MDGVSIEAARETLTALWGQAGATWVLPVLLGLGLAAATGLRTFLPLLMMAGSERLGLFGLSLNDDWSWVTSDAALIALGVAATVEFVGDKIPGVDHALHSMGLVARPVAAAVAAGGLFAAVDPTTAAVAGVIVGAPTALAFNAVQGGARVASTATTGGLGNPVLSLIEDVLTVFTVILALLAPILIPVVLVILAVVVFRLARRLRRFQERRRARMAA
ncbi:MAG: DUF4126 domain-containing protein [Alphaproteobacteria bacterium]|nr:DUF4126 domain-containing protein [Alphaproteobacteria bacterium]MBU1527115.1 DUF4126 domain-containing protein [Alphaproteobacteria bacterium]MBU2116071.1 DUF4126 domain-containing protein [Alphaproteobacteria bacterium]MBU2350689.1 DUF4126 domain-containing protein [Alphaproteobacteria bacterium]MBU2383306.1 DUF4126 domain-containing protein [Alphaproteobacteria bacterium]